MAPLIPLHIRRYLSEALPERTAGWQVACHVLTNSMPVTSFSFTKRAKCKHWSQPFGLASPPPIIEGACSEEAPEEAAAPEVTELEVATSDCNG